MIKSGDLCIVVKNVNPDKHFDKYIGRIITVEKVMLNDPNVYYTKSIPPYAVVYQPVGEEIWFVKDELKKIEPFSPEENLDEIIEIVIDQTKVRG